MEDIKPEAWGDPKPCPYKEEVTCHKALCQNCDYKPLTLNVLTINLPTMFGTKELAQKLSLELRKTMRWGPGL